MGFGVKPCCGQYGTCGTGTTCLSGCNPLGSTSVGYCAPVPVCQNMNYTFTSTDRIADAQSYNGDATQYDWTLEHQDNKNTSIIQNNELVLVMTEAGGGTRISTTRNVLYGNIEASIKTTSAAGVVTAFITMSMPPTFSTYRTLISWNQVAFGMRLTGNGPTPTCQRPRRIVISSPRL